MNNTYTRRGFLATSAAAALVLRAERAAAQSRRSQRFASFFLTPDAAPTLKALAAAALDTAKRGGATYTDVRFRVAQTEGWGLFQSGPPQPPSQYFIMGVGVRALINGYWGFAAYDELPSVDIMATLGTMAATQAGVNAKGPTRRVDLAPTPVVSDGQWTMPVEVDPFTVSYDEKMDFFMSMLADIQNQAFGLSAYGTLAFVKEARTLVTSEGTFTSQTVYSTNSFLELSVESDWETERSYGMGADFLSSAGAGWEYVLKTPYQEHLAAMVDDAQRGRRPKPVEIGRYDIVFDAASMASILSQTLGPATQLERAMGYLANEEGSSFLDDPLAMLGSYQVGSSLVTVTANRSMPGGGATVKWDEEGVEPTDTPLVTKGILTDFQTTRESSSWLAPYYQKTGRAVRSSGAAAADEATLIPRSSGANFVLAPDPSHDATFEDLVSQTKSGYAVKGGRANGDFQALNGTISGDIVYEIVNGKLGSAVSGAQIAFRAPEFWKNVAALGGAKSALSSGSRIGQRGHSRRDFTSGYKVGSNILTVPAMVTQLAVTDTNRQNGSPAGMIMPIQVN